MVYLAMVDRAERGVGGSGDMYTAFITQQLNKAPEHVGWAH